MRNLPFLIAVTVFAGLLALVFSAPAAYAQSQTTFGIIHDIPEIEAKPPGRYAKRGRKFRDVWKELHRQGLIKKRPDQPKPAAKKPEQNTGAIGAVGGIAAPAATLPAVVASPQDEAANAGGIGQVGGIESEPPDNTASSEKSAEEATPATDKNDTPEATGSAIGSVGGIGAVGTGTQ